MLWVFNIFHGIADFNGVACNFQSAELISYAPQSLVQVSEDFMYDIWRVVGPLVIEDTRY